MDKMEKTYTEEEMTHLMDAIEAQKRTVVEQQAAAAPAGNENAYDVYTFLKQAGVFYVATEDGDEPKVRPFSFVMQYDGHVCFTTDRNKHVYHQIEKNPKVEICAFKNGRWLRYKGTAVNCTTKEAKEEAIRLMPLLGQLYKADEDIMQVFYLEHAEANFCSMEGEDKVFAF